MWNGQPVHDQIVLNAEPVPSVGETPGEDASTAREMSEAARENNVWLVGGSIPEREGDKLYNTATVWSPEGASHAC